MTRRACWRGLGSLLVGLGLSLTMGCQTWMGGMTLPSPNYLTDKPDYIPHQPTFKLPNEMAAMQAAQGGGAPMRPGAGGPPAAPVAPPAP